MFKYKDHILIRLGSGAIHKYISGRCNAFYYGETEIHLKVRSGEHNGILL